MAIAHWTGRSRDPAVVSADIARVLTTELGLPGSPPAQVLAGDSEGVPAGSLLPPRERFSGMPAPTHCFVYVDTRAPRPFELRASVLTGRAIRRSFGLGLLQYAVPLTVPVPGPAALGERHPGRPSAFEGDPEAARRLNFDPELLALADQVSATVAGPDATHQWKVARLLTVEPRPQGGLLLARTLHRQTPGGWSLGAKEVLTLAARIETALT
ncbi:hypothetical protein DEJ44_35260 [Streptomyces venezuelae]|uniref:hypothetical protein n=1 Tax=Streptomyces venezuelae TaxID=54571 RepID=UPI00123A8E4D|nr:hypothetical protein [Streptomyces venezuelae]QES10372.1 hypothetical protein DEJ44_35260 [Streptomyces venezuelae]